MTSRVIFLSYASEDRWVAEQLRRRLSEGDVCTVWWDIEDMAGQRIQPSIRAGIAAAHEMVVLVTREALTKDWVRHEVAMADYRDIPVTLLLYSVRAQDLPDPWLGMERVDIRDADRYVEQARERARGES